MALKQNALYKKSVLENGLRIVTEKISGVRSVSIGVWVDVGSRDETKNENGLSHFLEHMHFKGTRFRSPREIAFSLESLGGSLNAFTSREQTCYHAVVLDKHLDKAVDVIADILTNSTISPVNIEREKSVVIEEIREVNETPSDLIHELFSDCFWRGQPIGWPIMGTEENVRFYKRGAITRYLKKHYRTGRIVVAATGNLSHKRLVNLVRGKLDFPEGNEGRGERAINPTGFCAEFHKNGSNQTHLCMGFPGISYGDQAKLPLLALHSYLGGGMSSVLFQKIREDKGMAYTIYTFPDFYRDSGVFGAYLATDKKHLHEVIKTILREFGKLKRNRLPQDKIEKINEQLIGGLLLSMESTSGRMNRLARQETLTGEYISLQRAAKLINRITANDILEIARKIFNSDNLTITSLGSASRKDLNLVDWSAL
jgi:predicted Zn-dependent peptidase